MGLLCHLLLKKIKKNGAIMAPFTKIKLYNIYFFKTLTAHSLATSM